MFENIEAVIFDLDGTVVDSMWMWETIDKEYLMRFGIELTSSEQGEMQKEIEGMSFSDTALYFKRRFKLEDPVDVIKGDWNNMARNLYAKQVTFKKGVLDFLKKLKSKGIKTGIATSNSRELMQVAIRSLEIDVYFDILITSCEVASGKPSPDIYLKAAELLHVKPEKCLVFEDIPMGILAGKRAGMTVCAVEDQYSWEVREEKKRLSDYYIEDFEEIYFE